MMWSPTDFGISAAQPRSDTAEGRREAIRRQRDPPDVHRQLDKADGKEALSNTTRISNLIDFACVLGGALQVTWPVALATCVLAHESGQGFRAIYHDLRTLNLGAVKTFIPAATLPALATALTCH